MTQPQFLKVRKALPNAPLRVFATVLVSSGIRPCEARGLRPEDFDFGASVIKVNRSVVSVSRENHPDGKTFLVRDYTKNGTTRRVPVDSGCISMVKDHIARHGFTRGEVIFPAELLVPRRPNSDTLTEQEMAALGFCEPVHGQVYRHGTMGAYTQAKCRCEGCRQWSRQYQRERLRAKSGRRRWEKSRDADEPYLSEQQWSKIWNAALEKSGIPFKPTAYQVRHTHGSWLIDAGENPKVVMGRLGHGDLRVTSRYVNILDEEGASAAKRFEGLLPELDEESHGSAARRDGFGAGTACSPSRSWGSLGGSSSGGQFPAKTSPAWSAIPAECRMTAAASAAAQMRRSAAHPGGGSSPAVAAVTRAVASALPPGAGGAGA
jgi:integrase